MNNPDIDLNLLRILSSVARERSVTRAARSLGLSQPTVSGALARLRDALGDELFVRSRDGMEPTGHAKRILQSVDQGLDLIRAGLRQTDSFDPATSDMVFNLLVSDIGEVYYLPRLMAHLRQVAPGVRLQVRELAGRSHADLLESSRADLAVGYLSHPVGRLRRRRLFSENFVCMCRPDHPVLRGPITAEQYRKALHVSVSRRAQREEIVDAALARHSIRRRVVLTLPHYMSAMAVVAETDLLMTIPARLGDATLGASSLRVHPLPFDVPAFTVSLFWHERMQRDPANQWIRETFIGLFGT